MKFSRTLVYSTALLAATLSGSVLSTLAYAEEQMTAAVSEELSAMPQNPAPAVTAPEALPDASPKPEIKADMMMAIEPVAQAEVTPVNDEFPQEEEAVEETPSITLNEGVAKAQPPIDVMPAQKAETQGIYYDMNAITHPQIEMTPDKSELVRLDDEAASIIIGNPKHLTVMAESPKMLVLVPHSAGATYFTVLNHKNEVIMQRHVIVASPKEKYIRVRRSCAGSANQNCQETSVYYCPDMCHQIIMADPNEQQQASGGPAGGPQPSEPGVSVE